MIGSTWKPRTCVRCGLRPVKQGSRLMCWRCTHPGETPPNCKVCGTVEWWFHGYCQYCHPSASHRSCIDCFAWGTTSRQLMTFIGHRCHACYKWGFRNSIVGICTSCQRTLRVKDGLCRPCRVQHRIGEVESGVPVRYYQLEFACLTRILKRDSLRHKTISHDATSWEPTLFVQEQLFDLSRDLRLFHRPSHADLTDPRVLHARALSHDLGGRNGWNPDTIEDVDRGLVMVLSGQPDNGNPFPYSEIVTLTHRGISVERVADVLRAMQLFVDDRPDTLAIWLNLKLSGLPAQMQFEIRHWVDGLSGKLPRSRTRPVIVIQDLVNHVLPAAHRWAEHHISFREIQRDQVKVEVFDTSRPITTRRYLLHSFRNMFRRLKRDRLIFRNPVTHMSLPSTDESVRIREPLPDEELRRAIEWSAGNPARRALVALAAAQALMPAQMRAILLEDIDLPKRSLTLGANEIPLHDLAYDAIVTYLKYRRDRWPMTRNRHLLISQQTAYTEQAVSHTWQKKQIKTLGITLGRLRQDRLMEELITCGPDPLHFQIVFGVGETTAIKYVTAAKRLLGNRAPT